MRTEKGSSKLSKDVIYGSKTLQQQRCLYRLNHIFIEAMRSLSSSLFFLASSYSCRRDSNPQVPRCLASFSPYCFCQSCVALASSVVHTTALASLKSTAAEVTSGWLSRIRFTLAAHPSHIIPWTLSRMVSDPASAVSSDAAVAKTEVPTPA